MAKPKRGQIMQFQAPARASSDGSLITTMTASDFNSGAVCKWFGVNHGVSNAFTSGTMSKAARLVSSGLLQFTLNATENNYDEMVFRARKTSMKPMFVAWNNADYDDSDLYSLLSDFVSDFGSRVPKRVATDSQLSNLASDLRSYLDGMSNVQSQIAAELSDHRSNFQSRVPKLVASQSLLSDVHSDLKSAIGGITASVSASDISDIASAVKLAMASDISDIYSLLSDLNSQFLSRVPKETAARSQLSDLASDLKSFMLGTGGGPFSTISNIYSMLSDLQSDFQSRVPKAVATNSQVSDLASDLKSYLAVMSGVLSDTYSGLSDLTSDFQSRVPKRVATDSQLSDVHSDLKSAIGNITVTIGASDISDIASAVVAGLPITSQISDIYSLLSDLNSQFLSRVPKETAARSQLSDLASDLKSFMTGTGGGPFSTISNIYSMLSDLQSDFQSRVPKAVATQSLLSDVESNLRSYLVALSGALSDVESQVDLIPTTNNSDAISNIYSLLSDLDSNFQSRVPKRVATDSQLSALVSDIQSYLLGMSGVLSDAYSLLTAGVEVGASSLSDLRSAILANGMQAAGADPTAVVGVTAAYGAKLDWLTALSRNKLTQTSTSAVLFNDASVAVASATVSDDGTTATRGEWH